MNKAIILSGSTLLLCVACKSEPSASPAPSEEAKPASEETQPASEDAKPVPEKATPPIDHGSVLPGTSVTKKGTTLQLVGTPIAVGKPFPAVKLKDAFSGETVDITALKGKVLIISVVPSVKTPVCEAQTHYLAEQGDRVGKGVMRITVSRDTSAELKSFAEAAKLTDISYMSDKDLGAFGPATGLGVKDADILARAVIVVDKNGVVQYLQVVPELTHLPDMDKAFDAAMELVSPK